MRYVIIGAGAIGGVIGARLAQHSVRHSPLLIARGEHARIIGAKGLRLRTPDEDLLIPIAMASTPAEVRLEVDDVLVFATKTHQVEAAILQWADQPVYFRSDDPNQLAVGSASEVLPAFMALNGCASERIALRFFDRVFGVCIWMPAVHLAPGEVIARTSPISGTFLIGRVGVPSTSEDSELLSTLRLDWQQAGLRVHLPDDVSRWKYAKLLSNLGNAVQALLGPAEHRIAQIDAALRREAEFVFRAAKIDFATLEEEKDLRGPMHIRPVDGISDDLGGSSWQSLARGSTTIETDYLNGEVALIARVAGIEAPVNARLQRLARAAASTGAGSASLTAPELEILLGL